MGSSKCTVIGHCPRRFALSPAQKSRIQRRQRLILLQSLGCPLRTNTAYLLRMTSVVDCGRTLQVGGAVRLPDRVLEPVERISEILFGLIMALTITGAVSVATADHFQIRTIRSTGSTAAYTRLSAGRLKRRACTIRSERSLTHRVRLPLSIFTSRTVGRNGNQRSAAVSSMAPAVIIRSRSSGIKIKARPMCHRNGKLIPPRSP